MTSKLKKKNIRCPIGLDIGDDSIKMIQLGIEDGQMSIIAADREQIEPSVLEDPQQRREFVMTAIKQMICDGNFKGREVVSCIPNKEMKVTSVRLSETDSREIEKNLRKEVKQRFGMDPDRNVYNYLEAGDVQNGDEVKNELILFAVEEDVIREHISILENAELRPVGIDAIPCALFRSYARRLRRQADKERTVVFIDVGSSYTTVVFGRSEEINFIKKIPIGGRNFREHISSSLGVTMDQAQILREKLRRDRAEEKVTIDSSTRQVLIDSIRSVAEELAKEISLCFRYYTVTFRGKRVERAVFSGGEAYEQILLNVLKRHLAVDVEVAEPLRGCDMSNANFDSDRRGLLCEWAIAVGLSLKGSVESIN